MALLSRGMYQGSKYLVTTPWGPPKGPPRRTKTWDKGAAQGNVQNNELKRAPYSAPETYISSKSHGCHKAHCLKMLKVKDQQLPPRCTAKY